MTTTTNVQLTTNQDLDTFAILLKDNGFTVILSQKPTSYFHFFKDGKMGYVQKSYYSGFDFSSTHKPCKEFGTGLSVLQNVMQLDLENANKAINSYGWRGKKISAIQKYKSAQEFIDSNKWAKYYIL